MRELDKDKLLRVIKHCAYYHPPDKSISSIAREEKISVKSVYKYLNETKKMLIRNI